VRVHYNALLCRGLLADLTVDPQRADRKEAERLMLWAIGGRQLALSSLTTEDAIAYLRHGCEDSIGPAEQYAISQFSPETNE
jgi:hypothetical protein